MKLLVRLEYAAIAILLVALYQSAVGNWWLFALLILAPDVSMVGYLAGPRIGAYSYNAVHSWLAPLALYAAHEFTGASLLQALALILAVHIAVDRAVGYGLKSTSGFKHTHLGRIGG